MHLFLLAACLIAPGAPAWETNFAENISAEADDNRDRMPDGWQAQASQSPARLAWDDRVAHRGRRSLRIADSWNPAATSWQECTGRWMSPRAPVVAGEPYTLEAWLKTDGVDGRANACIVWWASGKWLAESYTESVTGTHDWRRVSITVNAPAGATEAGIYLGLSRSKGTVWFDDVSLAHGSSLPARFRPVDLAPVANAELAAATGPEMAGLAPGDATLRGVAFRVAAGSRCLRLTGADPPVAIPVGQACQTLYFLHASHGGWRGNRIGQYEILLDDGSSEIVPLVVGSEIADWRRPVESDRAAVGWETASAEHESVALAILPVALKRPGRVREVRVKAATKDALVLAALTVADGPAVLTRRALRYEFTDTAAWYPFDFPLDDTNLDTIDLTRLLDAPAGKHGFLRVDAAGHFAFAGGRRARFFGTNLCGRRAACSADEARTHAARLAKYGVNLLRIHSIDGRWGPLFDAAQADTRHPDPAAMDRLDFLFAELKKRGIYVYFDLLDYRAFRPGDGVRDAELFQHGWENSIKGATCFNDRLIELQQEFATQFLTHRNPYTGLRYVDDPAVAVVETTNENSVFYFHNTRLTLPTYADELRARWNRWLVGRYGDRAGLAAAWTGASGVAPLAADEDPGAGSVFLPMARLYQRPEEAGADLQRSPARVNAMVRFFFELQRSYYERMHKHLRAIGVKVPLTGTNQTFCPASNYADAAADFMSRNNYWCHPNVHARPHFTFHNRAMVLSDIPATSNPVAEVASSTAAGKPMIVPEFNFPWPNEYRAEGLLLMTAYGCLQDWDGLLFFTYSPDSKRLEWFGNQSDPVRWGEYAAAALMFHRADVAPARNTVHVGYCQNDIFTARPSHGRDRFSPFRYLPYLSKVRNAYFQSAYQGDADVVVASGYTPAANYAAARRAIVFAKGPWLDLAQRESDRARCASAVAPNVRFQRSAGAQRLAFERFLGPDRVLEASPDTLADTSTLPARSTPVGLTAVGRRCLGLVDDRFCVVPDAASLGDADPIWDYRLFAESARRWGLPGYGAFAGREKNYVSDTGQLSLDRGRGLFTFNTPRSQGAVGQFADGPVELDQVALHVSTPFAAVVATSLDGAPLARSGRVLITAVARAENTGQAFTAGKRSVPQPGETPVLAEPVGGRAELSLPGPLAAYALDATGKRRNPVAIGFQGGRAVVELSQLRSPWCELVRDNRSKP